MDSQSLQLFEDYGFLPNWWRDEPDSRDRTYEAVYGDLVWQEKKEFPLDQLIIRDQFANPDTHMACTRYGIVHINNWQNLIEHWPNYTQINPRLLRQQYISKFPEAKTRWSSKQSAMKQMIEWGYTEWYAYCPTVEDCKDAIDNWKYIYTGSNNGDRVKTLQTGIYHIQDERIVWHIRAVVKYDDAQECFIGINSVRKNPVFKIPYKLWDTLYTKHAILDKDDHILSFKERHKKIKEYDRSIASLWQLRNNTDNLTERDRLHEAAKLLRKNKEIYYP